MARRQTNRPRCKTRKAQYGTQTLYTYEYRDLDPGCPTFRKQTWAYDKREIIDRFYDSGDDDGEWVLDTKSIKCVEEK